MGYVFQDDPESYGRLERVCRNEHSSDCVLVVTLYKMNGVLETRPMMLREVFDRIVDVFWVRVLAITGGAFPYDEHLGMFVRGPRVGQEIPGLFLSGVFGRQESASASDRAGCCDGGGTLVGRSCAHRKMRRDFEDRL